MHVALDRLIDEGKAFWRQRRTGGRNGAQRRQIMRLTGLQPGFQHGIDEFRRRAEIGHALGGGIVEQNIAVGIEGRTVIEQQRCAGGDARSQPVPHHPAAGGEVEEAVILAQIRVEAVFLQMLQQHAARPMHDAFGNARRAGRKEDIKRMIEGQPREPDLFRVKWLQRRIERNALFRLVGHGFRFAQIGDDDSPLQPRQFCRHFGNLAGHVDALSVIPVAVAGEEKLRLDLAETIEHTLHAEIWRTGRPDRADGRSGQHESNRLRHVGHHARYTIAGFNAFRQHELLQSRHQRVKIVPGQTALDLVLAAKKKRSPLRFLSYAGDFPQS